MTVVLAGDVGGTHARLALVSDTGQADELETYASDEFPNLEAIVGEFLARHPADLAATTIGVAGPVRSQRTDAVNLHWSVDAIKLAGALELDQESVAVINDLEAGAWGIETLAPPDLTSLNDVVSSEGAGTIALISAGTGLGQAFVTRSPSGAQVHPSEGSHVEFAARSDLEADLHGWLARRDGHISYEDVCSGIGLVNIYAFLRERSAEPEPTWLTESREHGDAAAAISMAALDRSDPVADEALDTMVGIYGAQAGNLALTVLADSGVYLGGGIPPKILPRLRGGAFIAAFTDKGRFSAMMRRIPVHVVLNEHLGLLGAARHALRGLGERSKL